MKKLNILQRFYNLTKNQIIGTMLVVEIILLILELPFVWYISEKAHGIGSIIVLLTISFLVLLDSLIGALIWNIYVKYQQNIDS